MIPDYDALARMSHKGYGGNNPQWRLNVWPLLAWIAAFATWITAYICLSSCLGFSK